MAISGITVKVCGIKKAEDAELIQALGGDFVGMIHHAKSPRHIEIKEVKALIPKIAPSKRIAVLVEPEIETVKKLQDAGVYKFQIHLKSSYSDQVPIWAEIIESKNLWLAPKLMPESEFPEKLFAYSDKILIDTYSKEKEGGTGLTGDWGAYRKLRETYSSEQFILAGGLSPLNICRAIEASNTSFIDLNSGLESAPGEKDPQLIKKLFQTLKQK